MGRWQKRLKKYERHVLLALVILLLVSFSVTGAIQCSQQGGPEKDFGGSFLVNPTKRASIDSNDFLRARSQYEQFRRNTQRMSLRWPIPPYSESFRATWAHLAEVKAARAAGYVVGEKYALPVGIRAAVQQGMSGMPFTEAAYDRFLREVYHGKANEFQDTVRDLIVKDAFLRPLVETAGFTISYEDAYGTWKRLLQRVDLEYVALRGDDFTTPALEREKTRERISRQEQLLQKVSRTAGTLDGLRAQVEGWKNGHDGTPPESLETMAAHASKDAWGQTFRYTSEGEDIDLRSPGPDGAFDSSDDVTLETLAQLETRSALRSVGDALLRWRTATEAWPETLDTMREAPSTEALAPLKVEGKDAWGNVVVYVPAEGEAAPRLFSAGADGESGTDDDVLTVVSKDRVIVPPGRAFVPFLLDEDKDAWDRPLRVDFAFPATRGWRVVSAGRDGVFDTDDDLDSGNREEIEAFFRSPEVRMDFKEPLRREFEALYVHLPLVPDDALATLWTRHEDLRPNESSQFDRWRQLKDYSYYLAEDPASAEEGHGAELVRRVAPDATATLVPDASIFGEPSEDFLSGENPDRNEYIEQGWRSILLREGFLENLMNSLLVKARESQDAVRAWEQKKQAFDAGEGEDPGEKPGLETFESVLAGEFGEFLPAEGGAPWIGYYVTERPLDRLEWESLEHLGGVTFSKNIEKINADGEYAAIPFILNDSHTKAILRRLVVHPERQQELDEVYDAVFDRYLEKKRLDVAEEALGDLSRRFAELTTAARTESEGEEEGAEEEEGADAPDKPSDTWARALEAWAADLGAPHLVEQTGWFVGARPPRSRTPGEDVPDAEADAIRRRDFVRTSGYELVRATVAADADIPKGTVGSNTLRDDVPDGTDTVYLVRLRDAQFPPPEAFSPRHYADYLTAEIVGGTRGGYGMGQGRGSERIVGKRVEALRDFFIDYDYAQKKFDIQPNEELPEETRGR